MQTATQGDCIKGNRRYRVLFVDDGDESPIHASTLNAIATRSVRGFPTPFRPDDWDAVVVHVTCPDTLQRVELQQYFGQAASPSLILIAGGGYARDLVTHAVADDVFIANDISRKLLTRSIGYCVERRRAERLDARMQVLVDRNPDAVLVTDLDGTVLYVNRAATSLFGRPFQDLLGENIGFSMSTNGVSEVQVLRGSGILHAEMHLAQIEWEGQTAILATLRDITAQRALQSRAHHAQKMEALGQLAGGVAHDFNNILMAIHGSVELACRRLEPSQERPRKLLQSAMTAALRGSALTRRMLGYAHGQQLEPAAINTAQLVRDIVAMLRRLIDPRITISADCDLAGPLFVWADAAALETTVMNLCLNARDAILDQGAIRLSIRVETLDSAPLSDMPSGSYVCISVTDNGHGMTEDVLSRCTQPFYTTKDIGKGTGLGLSMAHGFAQQSGGRLKVTSKSNVGTEVEIWLPQAFVPSVEELSEKTSDSQTMFTTPNARILVVDHDPLVNDVVSAMVEDLGFLVVRATSAEQALDMLHVGPPIDLLLCNYALARMTGLDLAFHTRRMNRDLPVILLTGYAEIPEPLPANTAKLIKPVSEVELASTLMRLLENRPDPTISVIFK